MLSRFSFKISLSHSAENFRGHSFNVSEKFGYQKKLCIMRVSHFSAGNCLSHSAENFCEGILLFLRKFLIQKIVYGWKGGRITYFCRKIWSLSTEYLREHPCNASEKLWYRKNLCEKGGITLLRQTFSITQSRNLSWESLQCFWKFGVIENFYA